MGFFIFYFESTWAYWWQSDLNKTNKSRVYLTEEATRLYLDRLVHRDLGGTGESKVYLAMEAPTVPMQNKRVEGILG